MDVLMPQLGETVAEGTISKWFVRAGDAVKPGDNLFEIETDKVSMEVPAIAAGTIAAIHVQAGEVAPVGAVVAVIQGAGEAVSTAPPTPLVPPKAGTQSQEKKELDSRLRGNERQAAPSVTRQMEPFREVRTPERNFGPARLPGGTVVTPLARRLAGEAGIDLANLKGSGPHGRIVARDVEEARRAPVPRIGFEQPLPQIVVTADVQIGQALTLCDQANASGGTIELADIIIKALGVALARVPAANAIRGDGVHFLHQSDIAFAVGKSLPVLHKVESLSLTAIAALRRDFVARAGHIKPDETVGGTTAVSIPGVPGITAIADVVHPPHTSMLSVGAPRRAPVEATDRAIKFVDMITVALTCDHRVIDGVLGAELLAAFKEFVEQPVTMIV